MFLVPAQPRRLAAAALLALAACGESPATRPNVLLVSVDTLRADHVGAYGYDLPSTPRIDALAAEGVLFEEARSTVPLTLPAHGSLLTGALPPAHGVRDNGDHRLDASNETLAERLRAAGYATAAVVGSLVLDGRHGLDQGFDTYDDRIAGGAREGRAHTERTADEVSARALTWLRERPADRPFFLFLHYYDPHRPWAAPAPFDLDLGESPYAAEIAYADHELGRVLDSLVELGLDDSTLVVVTSDHGEGLDEHGESTHGFFVYDATLRVPLVVRPPGGAPGRRIAAPVSLVDVAPTVLGLCGLPRARGVAGRDLAGLVTAEQPAPEPTVLYAESLTPTKFRCSALVALVEGQWKLIRSARPELYDLARDPGETRDLAAEQAERVERMTARLGALLADTRRRRADAAELDRRGRDDLAALGYVTSARVREELVFDGLDAPKDFIDAFEATTRIYAWLREGRTELARGTAEELLARHPHLVEMHYYLGEIALAERDFPRAAAAYETFLHRAESEETDPLRLAPSRANACNNYGFALLELGRPDEAIAQFRRAIELSPTLAEAQNNLGFALLSTGRPRPALRWLDAAIESDPEYADAHNNRGLAQERTGALDEARVSFERATELEADFADAHANLARLLEEAGQHARAVERYERALAAAPDDVETRVELAWLLATTRDAAVRDPDGALELVRGLDAPETTVAVLDVRAAALAASGDFEAAVEAARRALELARERGEDGQARALADHLEAFRSGRPLER